MTEWSEVSGLSVSDEQVWLQLRNHLARERSFWFGLLLTTHESAWREMSRRTEDLLAATGRRLMVIEPHTADELVSAARLLDNDTDQVGLHLVVSTAPLSYAGSPTQWRAAWRELFIALNRQRDQLRRRNAGLVLIGPPDCLRLIATTAVDLWSIRSMTGEITGLTSRHDAIKEVPTTREPSPQWDFTSPSLVSDATAEALREIDRLIHEGQAGPALDRALRLFGRAPQVESATVNEAIARAQSANHLHLAAASTLETVVAELTSSLGPSHSRVLVARNNLAYAYSEARQPNRAIPLYEQNLNDTERLLGPNHPNTLTSRNNLAYAYSEARQPNRAIPLYEQNLNDTERLLGPSHPNTLTSRNNLAGAQESAGQLDSAIALYEQVLADRERVLGPDHPLTLISRNNLAGALQSAGQSNRSVALYEQNLNDTERILGPDHPNTLTSRNNLAHAYGKAGQLTRAISLYERNLADRKAVLGPDHPNTLTSSNNLAHAYSEAGELNRAIPLYEETLTNCERVLGPNHPDTVETRENLEFTRQKLNSLSS